MGKALERDLGLYAVFTISIGAMVGSGIFVLPGLAATIAGPAVILAYLLAGLLVLPAALSKAEMATAMPEAGGTYLYIDRGMGPMLGTVAGFGAWVSLVFKSAFALVGLGAYLVLFTAAPVKLVALGLAVLLIVVNMFGAKLTGRFQAFIVTAVLGVLVFFVADGITNVSRANYHPFFAEGTAGLFAATGFVFVSYAGVTKIASVAEEVENPGRNIPLGILGSIIFMMVLYTLLVYVVVGVSDGEGLGESLTPMSDAAGAFMGGAGVLLIAITAVLALTSMANAGLLSSSRYPLAMSRDKLAPRFLSTITKRFRTPAWAIAVTGGTMLVLIGLVPVVELAKLASAFQILVFSMENLALIAFRESDLDWYKPTFRSPWYPWVQLFGIGGGVLLLTQMGVVPVVGAVVIVLAGMGWYHFYAKKRVVREGAAATVVRRTTDSRLLQETRRALKAKPDRVLVPMRPDIPPERERRLLTVAADIVRPTGGEVHAVQFEEVSDALRLSDALQQTKQDLEFEAETAGIASELAVPVRAQEMVTHDVKRAVLHYARERHMDLIVAEREHAILGRRLFGKGIGPFLRRSSHDVVFVKPRDTGPVKTVAVVADRGPYDPLKVSIADAIAANHGARIRFIYPLTSRAPDQRLESLQQYHEELARVCAVPTEATYIRSRDRIRALASAAHDAEVVVVGASASRLFKGGHFGLLPWRVGELVPGTVLYVHSRRMRRNRLLRYVIERISY